MPRPKRSTSPEAPSRPYDAPKKRTSRKGLLLGKVERGLAALLDEELPDGARRHASKVVRAVRGELERKQERSRPKRERRVKGTRGRPPVHEGVAMERQVAVRLRDEAAERLEQVAKALGVSTASVARVLIAQGLGLHAPRRSVAAVTRVVRPLVNRG